MSSENVSSGSRYDESSKLFIEGLFDEVNFDGLYQLAWETCLTAEYQNTQRTSKAEESPEQRLISILGTRGLSIALDIASKTSGRRHINSTDDEDSIRVDSPVRTPHRFGSAPDRAISEKIEQFGVQLLAEAYECLGADADVYLEEYTSAQNAKDQIKVLEWLVNRVKQIGHEKTNLLDGTDKFFYHPVRLSPKILGQYPDVTNEPTCLMRSILVSSFLEKAGAPYVHCGVMETRDRQFEKNVAQAGNYYANETKYGLAPPVCERLIKNARHIYWNTTDAGFHAVATVRLKDDSWYILDPNFDASYAVKPKKDNKRLSVAYEDLVEMSALGHGVERVVVLKNYLGPEFIAFGMLDTYSLGMDTQRVEEILLSQSYEILPSIKALFEEAINNLPESESTQIVQYLLSEIKEIELSFPDRDKPIPLFDEAFEQVWSKFVLWDQMPHEVIEKCRTDPKYLARRVADIQSLAPLVFLFAARLDAASFPKGVSNADFYGKTCYHTMLEIGLPHFRIGASVLSDFASYCDDSVSMDMWASQWSSRIPITEHNAPGEAAEGQAMLGRNLMGLLADDLRYDKQNVIIGKFYSREEG